MPKVSAIQTNFNGGEISPYLYGRVDSDRYKASLAVCKNYIPTIQGALTRRPGTVFVAETKFSNKQSRLIPFEFSTTQAYMLEFGDQYIRFFKDNAIITETAKVITGATQANPVVVTSVAHGYSNGDRVIITGVSGMTQLNNREFIVANVAANTFELQDVDSVNINGTGYGAYTSGGSVAKIYEISSPYLEANLFQLKYTQSADVLYLVHPSYPPRKLTRTAHTSWALTLFDFIDGPYLPTNTDETIKFSPNPFATGTTSTISINGSTITNVANNGSGLIRITLAGDIGIVTGSKLGIADVTGTTEANGSWTVTKISGTQFDLDGSAFVNAWIAGGTVYFPGLFRSTDVGRWVRIKTGTAHGWAKITALVNYGQVQALVKSAFGNATPVSTWRLGNWSDTTGYPGTVAFHEDRLMFGGATQNPQRLDASKVGDYEIFSPTADDGVVTNSNGLSFALNSNDVNVIRWITSDEKGLLAGSVGGEWVVRPSSQSEALSPTNVTAKRATSYGSANIQPVQAGKSTVYVQRASKKLREMAFFFDVDGFRSTDLTVLSEHITKDGVTQLAFQKIPQSLVWAVRSDGSLVSMTYERDLDSLKVGWHRHILGGVSDAANSDTISESVAVIPSSDGTRDDLWIISKRRINGKTKRYIEYLSKLFEDTDEQREAFFVDCGLTYDNPITITAATQANPVVVTAASHGLSNGDKFIIYDVKGMTELNTNTYIAANVTANTVELTNENGGSGNVNGTGFSAYVSGGTLRKMVSSISGLFHLEGQTVAVLGDGAVQPDKVVTNGIVTLSEVAATVHIGFNYNSDAQMLRIDAGAADGTAQGKTRRIHRMGMLLHRSLGLQIGRDFDNLTQITFRHTSDPLTRPPSLFSGIISETVDMNYDYENQFCWRQSQPLPSTVLSVMPQMHTQDRG